MAHCMDNMQLTLVARTRVRIQSWRFRLFTAIERKSRASTEDVTGNLSALRVTSKDELRVGALLSIRSHLHMTCYRAIVGRLTGQVRVECRIMEVFVAAACQSVADGFHKQTLTSWVGLIVSSCQEDVHLVANRTRIIILLSPDNGRPA